MSFSDILLGIAIGDAFGAGVEFQDRDWIKSQVDFSRFVNARNSIAAHLVDKPANFPPAEAFTQNYSPWDYTDDTEMTIGVVKALLSKQAFTPDLLVAHFTQEYQQGKAQKGFGRNGHGSMQWVFDGTQNIAEVRAFQQNRPYPGNAPVSRAVPLGLLPVNLISSYAHINADATHPHPKARVASLLIAEATHFLLVQHGDARDLIDYGLSKIHSQEEETESLLATVAQLPPPAQLQPKDYEVLCGIQPIVAPRFLPGIKGLPSDAMLTGICALYVLSHAQSAFDGLKIAVQMGGDVDSLASICTGVLAGRYGLDSLPEFMLKNIEGKAYLKQTAQAFEDYLTAL
ncbi:MAG TPA: ADP-ribosylglycohydrolase family protein [Microscillaceae bacterium]|nr:ADP-ribosylglycohydrolase family protein [Microscillaceae bacterium]